MKLVRKSSENEMILDFLKGELFSDRFNESILGVLSDLELDKNLIVEGNLDSNSQNELRKKVIKNFRGYPSEELFNNFPKIYKWDFVEFDETDIDKIYYINYDYWNELSKGTSKPKTAAKTIESGVEIYNVSNKPFVEGAKILERKKLPPVILITCNEKKYLIIEGHSRMTLYGMKPRKFEKTNGYVGYCSIEDMKKYDSRMVL